jgi:hypothetical protein
VRQLAVSFRLGIWTLLGGGGTLFAVGEAKRGAAAGRRNSTLQKEQHRYTSKAPKTPPCVFGFFRRLASGVGHRLYVVCVRKRAERTGRQQCTAWRVSSGTRARPHTNPKHQRGLRRKRFLRPFELIPSNKKARGQTERLPAGSLDSRPCFPAGRPPLDTW